jgi:hypothetical protein
VTPDGAISEFPLSEGTRGAGLSAGSERQPPTHLVDRLHVADSGNNRIAYLQFGAAGRLHPVDARQPGPLMEEITRAGIDIDRGMVLKVRGQLYDGDAAMHAITLMSSGK